MNRNKDDRFVDCFKVAIDVDENNDLDIRKYVNKDERSSDEAKKLMYILNQYEYLSVGIKNNAYNEQMLKDAIFSTTVRLYEVTAPYIKRLNEPGQHGAARPTAYSEFSLLAQKWMKEGKGPHKPKKSRKWYQIKKSAT